LYLYDELSGIDLNSTEIYSKYLLRFYSYQKNIKYFNISKTKNPGDILINIKEVQIAM
jgi:hypothetical protein